ncbi:MAG TPA: YdeI/OmpD-associated family protein [Candidatus Udaeobacter sp.]|nr:YdeI/OmpD-associated family protein [Candidatus Udaeobacter sp.]
MKLGKTLYVSDRKSWREWLSKNYNKESEIWLIYYRKDSGKPRISYNDAVEEALCYGWIDSTIKSIDKESFAQRFSVRKKTSNLSQMNKERIYKLIAQKQMTKAGLAAISHVFDVAKDKEKSVTISPDILKPLKANKEAWENFQSFPESYKRIRIAYIESRKRHGDDQFIKSLTHFINMTAKNKRIGFVKEMK